MVMPASANEYDIDWTFMPELDTAAEFIAYQNYYTFVSHTMLMIIVPVAMMCILPMGIRNAVCTLINPFYLLIRMVLSL